MTPLDIQQQFNKELKYLLNKYKAEISLENYGTDFRNDHKIVVSFDYDETLIKDNNTGIIPDLVLGIYFR